MRDDIVETLIQYKNRTQISTTCLLRFLGLSTSKYYEWQRRYGVPNQHNGQIPKANWLFDHEKQAIIDYALNNREEGYRRLCYRMIDDDVVYASPSTVYRVLHTAGLLYKFIPVKNNKKGMGFF